MKRILSILLVAVSHLLAQDTTCNAGDYAVVVATNNADVGTAGGAEFNSTTATWGIQAAFDAQCSGLRIRIVCDGTNQYGSASNSWTNRDADKAIDIDLGTVNTFDPVWVMGYSDATTPLAAGSYCDMDFNGGTAGAFVVAKPVNMSGINIKNAPTGTHSIQFNVSGSTFHHNKIEGGGASGFAAINVAQEDVTLAFNRIERDTGTGIRYDGNASGLLIYRNTVYSATDSLSKAIDAAGANQQQVHVIGNIFHGGNDGISQVASATTFPNVLENTFYSMSDDAIDINSTSNRGIVAYNIFADNTGYAIEDAAASCLGVLIGNSYSGNTAGNRLDACTSPRDYESGALDTTTVTFVDAAGGDFEVTAGAVATFTFPGGLTATTTRKGAVHVDSSGSVTNILIQGER